MARSRSAASATRHAADAASSTPQFRGTPLHSAPTAADDADIIEAEVIEDGQESSTSQVVVTARHEITPAMYLERPRGLGKEDWDPTVDLAGRVGYSAVQAAGDMWPHLRPGEYLPGWVSGRLGKVAARCISRDRLDAEYVLRCSKALPLLAKAYEDEWVARFNDTPPLKYLIAAVFDAFDLAVQGKVWGAVVEALRVAARRGTSTVTRAYVDVIARANGVAVERSGSEQATQGEVLQSAYQLALAKQEALDRTKAGAVA